LNLVRGANSAVNYYGVIRPQQETARSLQMIQQQLQSPSPSLAGPEESANAVHATGHTAQFANYGHYFPLTPARLASPTAAGLGRR
jgi:hypothetical protein